MRRLLELLTENQKRNWYVAEQPDGRVFLFGNMPTKSEETGEYYPKGQDLNEWTNIFELSDAFRHLWAGKDYFPEPILIADFLAAPEYITVKILDYDYEGVFLVEAPKEITIRADLVADVDYVAIEFTEEMMSETPDWIEIVVNYLLYEYNGEEYEYVY